jgi:hypothetical protein
LVTVTQTHLVPYVNYHWTPVVLPSATIATTTTTGVSSASALVGSSAAGLPVQAAAGLPVGVSGFQAAPVLGLGNVNLAAASGLSLPGAVQAAAAPSDLELQLLRALLTRAATTGPERPSLTPAAAPPRMPPADCDCETLLRQINALNAKIDAEIRKLRDEMTETDKQLAEKLSVTTEQTNTLRDDLKTLNPADLRKKVEDLQKRLKEIEENKKIKELLGK